MLQLPHTSLKDLAKPLTWFGREFLAFSLYFVSYIKMNMVSFSFWFERQKNVLVRFFMMKRGRYNRPFLHLTTMTVLGIGVTIAPVLADTYPLFASASDELLNLANAKEQEQSITVGEDVFETFVSQKPRDKIVTYVVQNGDTISTIAEKFGVSSDTVKWANDLASDNITAGDRLKILPVSGILHKVISGETVFTIAKRYDTDPQKIVDFPFNDFANPETFALVVGQELIVPDGIKPSTKPRAPVPRRQVYSVSGPTGVTSSGFTWPLSGGISQYPTWYHMAIDIMSDFGAAVVAAQDGKVSVVSEGTWDGGYGNNVWIDNGAGLSSHYAHMNRIFVRPGDTVVAGQTIIGEVGMSGRTTGPHLHFEIAKNGVLVNPLPYLP